MKNLDYAIAVAKRPGFIEYHKPSDEIHQLEQQNTLSVMAKSLASMQRDIDQVQGVQAYAADMCFLCYAPDRR
jgi:hypothetical protein